MAAAHFKKDLEISVGHTGTIHNRCLQARCRVLLIENDREQRESHMTSLIRAGVEVEAVTNGGDALRVTGRDDIDVVVIDDQLCDVPALNVVRQLRGEKMRALFIFMTDMNSLEMTVEAMRMGASALLRKPLGPDDLVMPVLAAFKLGAQIPLPSEPGRSGRSASSLSLIAQTVSVLTSGRGPGSSAERWALHVLRACSTEHDPKTLKEWATVAWVSYRSLQESCYLLDLRPHDARDFTRVLRVLLHASDQRCHPAQFLDARDTRTLSMLSRRAGLHLNRIPDVEEIERYLERQQFIASDNPGLHALRRLLTSSPHPVSTPLPPLPRHQERSNPSQRT